MKLVADKAAGDTGNDELLSDVEPLESKVDVVQPEAVLVLDEELEDLVRDVLVEAGEAAVEALQVPSEDVKAILELAKDDGLCLEIADGLENDLFGCLLENGQLLLHDVDLLCLADVLLVQEDDLLVAGPVEVLGAEEPVEVVERLKAVPAVEGDRGDAVDAPSLVDLTTGVVPLVQTMCLASWVVGQWLCSSGTNEDRRQGHRKKAGAREHDDFEK